jgi:hypothetical protein
MLFAERVDFPPMSNFGLDYLERGHVDGDKTRIMMQAEATHTRPWQKCMISCSAASARTRSLDVYYV